VGFGLHHLAQPKAHASHPLGHGTGRGQLLRAIALLSQRLPCRLGREPRGGEARAKRRVLVRRRLGELTQRCSHLRMPLCPAFAAPEGCLSPQTKAPSASLRQTPGHGLASPTKKGGGQPGVAPAMFQRQLGRKGSSFRSAQLGCRQTESGALRCTEQRLEGKPTTRSSTCSSARSSTCCRSSAPRRR
jgi:hypothetical protein